MKLKAPCQATDFHTSDIYGNPFRLSDHSGKRVMLSFFRDAGCPFCNFRIYELTQQYPQWKAQNLDIIAVFSDTDEQVRRFVARHPRPFTMLADPNLELYNQYGIEHSGSALLKAFLFRFPTFIKGLATGGRPSNNPHVKLVPADFLIDEQGLIQRVWYAQNVSDHIPLQEVRAFMKEGHKKKRAKAA